MQKHLFDEDEDPNKMHVGEHYKVKREIIKFEKKIEEKINKKKT